MNLSIFLMAGSESTSIAISVLFYVLAGFQEEQEKLIQEIDDHYPSNSDVDKYYYYFFFV
jgi:cytochrome P450